MASDNLTVSITLHEVKSPDALVSLFPLRVLSLSAPDWSIKIGRATSSGSGPRQSDINAWYSSRVVSREHAELKADPVTRDVLIRDYGSMHGTHVEGRRLKVDHTERIYPGDSIIFGAEVARGDETFLPVEVVASYEWSDGISEPLNVRPTSPTTRNHFAVYYSDEELPEYDIIDSDSEQSDMYGEDPVEQIGEEQNVSVPESEVSEDPVGMSSDEGSLSDEDSPTSSSIMPTSFKAKRAADELNEADGGLEEHIKAEVVSSNARVSPALGEPSAENIEDDYEREDSYYDDSSIFDEEEEQEGLTNADVVEVIDNVVEGLSKGKSKAEILRKFEVSPASPPPQSRLVREPSPSDAAMAKPPTEDRPPPPFGYYCNATPPLPIHDPYYQAPQTYLPPTAVERNPSAWAGYNSILYDAITPAPVQASYPLQSHYQVPAPIAPAVGCTAFSQPREAPYNDTMMGSASPPSDVELEALQQALLQPAKRGEKRKRDDTQDDEILVKDSVEVPEDKIEPPSVEITTIDPADLQLVMVAQTVDSIKSPVAEPVKKKQKKSKKDHGARKTGDKSTFASHAVTALAGVAVGAVGAILGLVALPKDFFV